MSENEYSVVHWVNEDKAGVVDIGNILLTDRKEGALAMVKHGKKRFPAKVVMLTNSKQAADKRCTELQFNIAAELKSKAMAKRVPKPADSKGKVATQKQMSSALGEKCPVPASQVAKKKKFDEEKKKDRKNERAAETILDEELSGHQPDLARKALFQDEEDYLISEDEKHPSTPKEKVATEATSESTCSRCQLLKKHGNAAIECFLTDLIKFLGLDLGERYVDCSEDQPYQLVLKPLPPGLKVVDLAKHHGVLVTKAGLSRILLSGGDDPKALVREALVELYGKEALKRMSGTKSLQKHVMEAIQSFVMANTSEDSRKKANWGPTAFKRVCNQKSSGLRHKSKSPSATGKKQSGKKGSSDGQESDEKHGPEDCGDGDDVLLDIEGTGEEADTTVKTLGKGEKMKHVTEEPTNSPSKKSPWKVAPLNLEASQPVQVLVPSSMGNERPSSRNSNASDISSQHKGSLNAPPQHQPLYNQGYPPPPASYHHPSFHHVPYPYPQPTHFPGYDFQHQQGQPHFPTYPPYQPYPQYGTQQQQAFRTPTKQDASLGKLLLDISNN